MTKIGINGFGRIGRMVLRAARARGDLEIVAVNELLGGGHLAYLLKHDSVHGRFAGIIEVRSGALVVDGRPVRVTAERDPGSLRWAEVEAEVVVESTGMMLTGATAKGHLAAGAKRVVISAPAKD